MKHRFLDEYANYVRKRFEAESFTEEIKQRVKKIDRIPRDVRNGFITVTDAMKFLVSQEEWLSDYLSGDIH